MNNFGQYQKLYRRYMRCLDVQFSGMYTNQEKWMLDHLDELYTEEDCKRLLYEFCNPANEGDKVPLDFRSIEELELKLAIFGC